MAPENYGLGQLDIAEFDHVSTSSSDSGLGHTDEQDPQRPQRQKATFGHLTVEIRWMIYSYILRFPRITYLPLSLTAAATPWPRTRPSESPQRSTAGLSPILTRLSTETRRFALRHYESFAFSYLEKRATSLPETTVSTNFYFNPKVDVVVVPYPSFNRDFTSSSPPTPPQPDVSAAVKHVLLLYNIIKRHHPDGWSVQGQFPNVKTVTVLLDSNISTRKDTGGRPKYDNIWGINGKDVDLRTLNLDVAYVDELQLVYDLTTDHDVKRLYRHSQVNGDARWLKESCQDFGGPKGGGWRQSVQTKIMKLLKANSLDKSENKPRPPTGFIDLPFELREMIWNYALQQEPARVINLRPTSKFFNESGSDLERRLLPNGAHGPALLHACYESRAVALQKYTLQKMHFSWSAPFYFDSSKDIVALVFTDAAAVEKRKDMADLPPPVRDIDEASPRTLLLPFSTLQKIPMPNADARDSLIQWFAHYPNVHTYIILLDADVYNAGAEAYGGLPEEHYDPAEVVDAFEVAGPNSHRWQAYAETLRRGWVVVYLMRNMSRLFKIYGLRFEVRIVKIKERQGPSAMYMSRAGD